MWGAIGIGVKKLFFLPPTIVNAMLYRDKCLVPNLQLLKDRVLVQDGARAHTAEDIRAYLSKNGVKTLKDWPPRSPDLNPIENLWAILARKVSDFGPTDEHQLQKYIKAVWDSYPQNTIDNIVMSFAGRVTKCIKSKGKKVK